MELFHLVKRGAEVCFWEEILAPSKELGGSGQVGKVMPVSAGSAQLPADNSAELQTKTPSLEQLLARS